MKYFSQEELPVSGQQLTGQRIIEKDKMQFKRSLLKQINICILEGKEFKFITPGIFEKLISDPFLACVVGRVIRAG